MIRIVGVGLICMVFAACGSMGPSTVPRDQFNYNEAIADSTEEQLLLNLVRLRYSETPVFLKVSSVIAQYTRSASANAGATANGSITGEDTASIGGRVAWADRPTITYTPVAGQEFSRNLLTPIPPAALIGLIQSGWPAELVLADAVWSMNDINNDISRPSRRREAEPEFFEIFEIWNRLREATILGMRTTGLEGGGVSLFLDAGQYPAEIERDIARFQEILGLDASSREFTLSYGLVPNGPNDIAMLTGSVWDIMLNMAWQIEVPTEHIAEGRTDTSFAPERPGWAPTIRVVHSNERPEDAFVAVYAHDHWFSIEQTDRTSKRAFSFLQILLNLSETGDSGQAPLVTISN